MGILIGLVNTLVQGISLVIVVNVFLSYVLPPYNPSRLFLDRLIEPMLKPIRRLIPPIGMVDFSPLVLILLVQLVGRIIISGLISLT